ncbi:hypothetical protein EV356DRAFT_378841 [Viridothelium virens]|uniref:C2H2-type domain-containing protein n=1 Tax=Viridothelium virens TaxID=1048519 RepID=A0A6A6HI92_VIRVR|nr:hypothetical protein EV356DRAFT_378841 [Viridothelium virens]
MAMITRSTTPSQTVPFSATDDAPNTPTSLASNPQANVAENGENPNLLNSRGPGQPQGDSTGFSKSLSPKSGRRKLSQFTPPPLTGAAAMADERKTKEQKAQQRSQQTSPNPAAKIIDVLLSGGGTSKPRDAPPETVTMNDAVAKAAKKIQIPETNVISDQNTTSPVSMSSVASLDSTTGPSAMTAPVTDAGTAPPLAAETTSTSAMEGVDRSRTPSDALAPPSAGDSGNRAFTYPGPVGNVEQEAAGTSSGRSGGSLPPPSYNQNSPKSPGTKRHKCPYCSTDFTRHHNLKSHLLTHSQEKPYVCQTCQARFRRLHDLKRHTKLHTGERPHTCPKCGRRFARGDALARHNKGQGGCAGRRSSFGADDDFGDGRGDDSMDGLMYHGEGAGDGGMEEDEDMPDARRRSEPSNKRLHRQDSGQAPFHHHSSTYPPPAARLGSNVMHPPGGTHQGSFVTSPRESTAASPKAQGSSMSSNIAYGTQNPGMIAYGMTESPKPLSPSQSDPHRLSVGDATHAHRNRSPSLNQQLHQQQFGRGTGRGTPPMGFAPPPSHPHPQLPALPGLSSADPRRSGDSRGPAPSMLHQQLPQPGGGTGSNPGSLSSHGQSSGGSMREVLGGGPSSTQNTGQTDSLWNYVRDLEGKIQRMQDEYELRISRMNEEIIALRNGSVQHR